MSENPLISVIIPVYNVKEFLRACVERITAQTYTNLEILLVDDGSNDGSEAICDEYAARDPRVCVLHKPNGGQASARNAALDIARGEFISFVDSDDLISFDLIETLFRLTQKFCTKIAMCGYAAFSDESEINNFKAALNSKENQNSKEINNPEKIENSNANAGEYKISPQELFRRSCTQDPYFSTAVWRALFAREIFAALRFPTGQIYEDVAIFFDIFNASIAACTDEILYFYRVRAGSTVNSFARRHLAVIAAVRRYTEAIAANYPSLAREANFTRCESALNTAFLIIKSSFDPASSDGDATSPSKANTRSLANEADLHGADSLSCACSKNSAFKNSSEQNYMRNSKQNSASQRKIADPRSPLSAAEAVDQIHSLHALVRERLDFGFFAAHASRTQTLMMVLFYASPALLRLFYKIYRKLK
ncbi:glycosyltransferase family 2 protein [uncultured Campylobacter sp.]|uniref:glycosyltransferase family 2 protein n=1 Tax=uncultured Campylobacter sp. TaxID=218934 RepID=UPI00261A1254|nr:glycosyltransferase family 2 protein [uncultured Campylobacter sp.]